MWRSRWRLAVCLIPLSVLAVGLLRPPSVKTGLPADLYWLLKSRWGPDHDMVLAGDSRIYRSASPAVLEEILADRRIVNYGFSGNGLTPSYLDAVEGLLDPQSKHRAIVVGVTPHSLTPESARDNGFMEVRRMHPAEVRLRIIFGMPLHFLRTFDAGELWSAIAGRREGYYQVYYPDGWVASRKIPDDPKAGMKAYSEVYHNNRVDETMVRHLIEKVRQWTAQGIEVYAFRPPTTLDMLELEREQSGFNEPDFVRRFEGAGGTWFTFPIGAYHSYDGSHLRADSAEDLSRDLGRALAAHVRFQGGTDG